MTPDDLAAAERLARQYKLQFQGRMDKPSIGTLLDSHEALVAEVRRLQEYYTEAVELSREQAETHAAHIQELRDQRPSLVDAMVWQKRRAEAAEQEVEQMTFQRDALNGALTVCQQDATRWRECATDLVRAIHWYFDDGHSKANADLLFKEVDAFDKLAAENARLHTSAEPEGE